MKKFIDWIKVIGAREHNLKNINVDIPKNSLTVITGPSGSGKSSLALDILYTEGKRRYIESLSSYARQFLGSPKKPDVERIDGLCPAIAIDQKTVGSNPRSTVGTITEIYDYLRVLFARIGVPYCPECNIKISTQAPDKIAATLINSFKNLNIIIAAPIAISKKGEFKSELENLFLQGYYRFSIDGQTIKFKNINDISKLNLKKNYQHSIDVLLDSAEVTKEDTARLQDSIEHAFRLTNGLCKVIVGDQEHLYSSNRMCLKCTSSFPELEPRLFSFNSPIGACKDCHGLGVRYSHEGPQYSDYFEFSQEIECTSCKGKRLNNLALAVKINNKNIYELGEQPLNDLMSFIKNLKLDKHERDIADKLLKEITNRLEFLSNVGLEYLSLNRPAKTLSGGEGQRIRLATQIGSALSGVLYILDEPSIGLHQRDNDRLINTLYKLRDQGNTVVVVEHDTDTMLASDYIIDMGPKAGIHGGQIIAVGDYKQIQKNTDSLTGAYLAGRKVIKRIKAVRKPTGFITLKNANTHNLKNLDVKFPLGVMCGVSGVSGSGKSTLIMHELVPHIEKILNNPYYKKVVEEQEEKKITGLEKIENLVVIDQSPIGRTSRSTPATYLGIFDEIRKIFATLPESKARGYQIGRFSFNVDAGRCSQCLGEGSITVSMHFLPDITMVCNICKGQRYNAQTLEINYKGKNIAQVLDMTTLEATEFFKNFAALYKRLKILCDVGLDYIKLGQSSTTLSGGEAQRIKLVNELAKRGSNTLYILDEPTTGLHMSDIEKLLQVLNNLIDKGNSIIVIEHNLDVLKTVDYLIDLGPEGGQKGGQIVASGTPEQVANNKKSHTGAYLKKIL
ncbi:excinuclease ABC subunit UvrA [Candidatus Dependentiae bacterium]|nr:excinuclease ABC subunit UvrA [Candidatus Dependentiae bacterium]